MGQQKPTVLIVHSAWHTPQHYSRLLQAFQSADYEAICPLLPTCNNAIPPNKKLTDDATLIRRTAQDLLREGKEVITICHSYGGIVATEALHGLSVKRIIYMCAFVPLRGEGLAGIFGGNLPPWIYKKDNGTLGLSNPDVHLYNDVSDAQTWVDRLVTHPTDAQHDPVGNEAWRTVPTSYIVCEKDQALPPALQMMMVGRVQEKGVEVCVETCSGSHSPFLSVPEQVVDIVARVPP